METNFLIEEINNLDPKVNRALIDVLASRYNQSPRGQVRGEEKTLGSESDTDPFAELFQKTVDELNLRYIEVSFDSDYILKRHPDLYWRTEGAEDRLNEVWKAGLEGKATVEEFREALKKWYRLHIEQLAVYKREVSRRLQRTALR